MQRCGCPVAKLEHQLTSNKLDSTQEVGDRGLELRLGMRQLLVILRQCPQCHGEGFGEIAKMSFALSQTIVDIGDRLKQLWQLLTKKRLLAVTNFVCRSAQFFERRSCLRLLAVADFSRRSAQFFERGPRLVGVVTKLLVRGHEIDVSVEGVRAADDGNSNSH